MNADGSNQTQVTETEGGYPRFVTPDGKWVYYESDLHQSIWRAATDGSAEMPISKKIGYSPAFSPDGMNVAYFVRAHEKDESVKILVANLADGKIVKVIACTAVKTESNKIAWLPDSRTLVYVTDNALGKTLWQQSLDEAEARQISDLGDEEIANLSVSPDGETIAFTRGKWLSDAVLIEGLK